MMRHRPFGVSFDTGERGGTFAGAWPCFCISGKTPAITPRRFLPIP